VTNTDISGINGTIVTNVDSICGYTTSIHIGSEEFANGSTAQANIDIAYIALMALPASGGGLTPNASAFGSGEILAAGVYDVLAGSLGGYITIDAA
jgi:hypothetical protein